MINFFKIKGGRFPFHQQLDLRDCGPTCLKMITEYYQRVFRLTTLRNLCSTGREGSSLSGMVDGAEQIGFRTQALQMNYQALEEIELPCIVHWQQDHYIVVYKVTKKRVYVADPGLGKVTYSKDDFLSGWCGSPSEQPAEGIVLALQPTPEFYKHINEDEESTTAKSIVQFLLGYKKLLLQLLIGLSVGSLLQLTFPILTQMLVDTGLGQQNINFVYLILAAQLMLFVGRTSITVIQQWILLLLGASVNMALLSNFIGDLIRLPIVFFEKKLAGDIIQRINDHARIETFLTQSLPRILLATLTLLVFSGVLIYYNNTIFNTFIIGTAVYIAWLLLFMKQRLKLEHYRFQCHSLQQDVLMQLVYGMQDLKLHNCERKKRNEWDRHQTKIYRLSLKVLKLEQWQGTGGLVIHELKNIAITFISVVAVIQGELTLGMMLSIQFIIGQLNGSMSEVGLWLRNFQDAKATLARFDEVNDEMTTTNISSDLVNKNIVPSGSIQIKDLSFRYDNSAEDYILSKIDFLAEKGKTTAIVGSSGSGKTTLLKLMLNFYPPELGRVFVGSQDMATISQKKWWEQTGEVMQEGYIFNDTIADNIALGNEMIDIDRLNQAVDIANLADMIELLPRGLETKIGNDGRGLSQGQKQRLLIARAVYKDPQYLFFDEATNALDANNEKTIMHNLDRFLEGRTSVIVAHRLSTVMNADQIYVLEHGKIVESGNHQQLVSLRGYYYRLVQNQLELGN